MEVNFNNPLQLCLLILKYWGLHNDGEETFKTRRVRKIGRTAFTLLSVSVILAHFSNIFTTKSIVKMLISLVFSLITALLKVKTWNVVFKNDEIIELNQLIDELEKEMSKENRHKSMEHFTSRMNFTVKSFKFLVAMAVSTCVIILILTIVYGKFPIDVFWEFEDGSAGAYISAIYMNLICIYAAPILISIHSLPNILTSYALGFLDELAARLKCIGMRKEFDYEEFKECVRLHQMIENFVNKVNDCFRPMHYLTSILSEFIICMYAFCLVYAEFNEVAMAFAFALLSIQENFVPCYLGSELEKSSENLMDAIYQSDWLNCELKTKKMIVTFMENLKQPMKINCYSIFDINLARFAHIINEAYSYYCVLAELAG